MTGDLRDLERRLSWLEQEFRRLLDLLPDDVREHFRATDGEATGSGIPSDIDP